MSSRQTDRPAAALSAMDAWLLLMVAIWGGNYSVVKAVFREIPPLPFNALRLLVASGLFLSVLEWQRRRGALAPIPRRDWLAIAGLGVVGHFLYQGLFISGLARTSVANSALILGCSPVVIALLAAAVGQERIGRGHWAAAALSVAGLYLVAGRSAQLADESLAGDAIMIVSIGCWAVYTVYSRPLLARHSPTVVTGYSIAIGTALFVPATAPALMRLDWGAVSPSSWAVVVGSAVLAINVSYLIWYTAVQRIGNARTSLYSNMVPVAAMAFAWLALGERVDAAKIAGAGAILSGVLISRVGARGGAGRVADPPAEE